MTSDTAKQIVQRAQAGDAEALSRLVDTLRAPLFAAAYRELRHYDNAQDAVANALLRIIKYLPRLQNPEQVQAWAVRIARNEARRLIRPAETALPDDDTIAAETAGFPVLRLDIERELRRLPRDQAHACALFYFEGNDIAQIAGTLGRPEGTIKYWLHRVRGQLRDRLKEGYRMDTLNSNTPAPKTPKNCWTAVIAGSDFAPATVAQVEQSLRNVGWETVHLVDDALALSRIGHDKTSHFADCQLIVLGEHTGGRSAFELCANWRATDKGKQIALFLIADGNRSEEAFASTAMAAYVAGFDMLLARPFDIAEFEAFARRIRTMLEKTTV